jgi:hypothetical protein
MRDKRSPSPTDADGRKACLVACSLINDFSAEHVEGMTWEHLIPRKVYEDAHEESVTRSIDNVRQVSDKHAPALATTNAEPATRKLSRYVSICNSVSAKPGEVASSHLP